MYCTVGLHSRNVCVLYSTYIYICHFGNARVKRHPHPALSLSLRQQTRTTPDLQTPRSLTFSTWTRNHRRRRGGGGNPAASATSSSSSCKRRPPERHSLRREREEVRRRHRSYREGFSVRAKRWLSRQQGEGATFTVPPPLPTGRPPRRRRLRAGS